MISVPVSSASSLSSQVGALGQLFDRLLMNIADFLNGRFLGLGIDLGDQIGGEIEHPLEIARRDIEQQTEAARGALHVPDMRDRRGELDVAHALAANLGAGNFHTALVAYRAGVANALVFAAIALPVLGRTENALAEQARHARA